MTTHLAAAEARHQQAVAALADAEAELLAAMRVIYPAHATSVEAMADRRFEALLEGRQPFWELAQAFGTYRRAQRAEAKARSAAYRAKFAAVPAAPPASPPARRKKAVPRKMTIGAYFAEARAA
jgi:hypothetical protein